MAIELGERVALVLCPTFWRMLAAEEGNQRFPCQLVRDLVPGCGERFDWVQSNAWPSSIWLGRRLLHTTKPPPSLHEFWWLHVVGGCVASARLTMYI